MMKKNILKIYKKMIKIRKYDEKIISEYSKQQIRCPVHLSIGQEAISAGILSAMSDKDIVMSNHRAHGHYIAKGCDLQKMTSEIYGKKNGCAGGKGGSMHLIDLKKNFFGSTPIVASTLPILTGIAFANKLKQEQNLSIIFFGDGAYESGNFHECLNFASTNKLKILFVCENNYFSVYSPLKYRQPLKHRISEVAKKHNILSKAIDGNKADKIFNVTENLKKKIIQNEKPGFLELFTYRHYEHCGPNYDDNLDYRDLKITKQWIKKDPIIYFEKKYKNYLQEFNEIKKKTDFEINKIFNKTVKESYPDKVSLFRNLYAD
jgi:TPP-dependent pyruvate/acetoin dehydrogenase alpha subunit